MLNSMGMGGIENFIMNVYRQINREEYQFDFVLQCEEESYFEKEITELGGKIYKIPRFEKHPISHIQKLKQVLQQNEFVAFHRHTASSVVFIDLLIAKNCGIQNRIVHSHNTSNNGKVLNYLMRPFLFHYSTKRLACSSDAGKWLYGNRQFTVIYNGIDTEKYQFSDRIREKVRKQLQVDDKIVIGHIGRFSLQKNHRFLLQVFSKLYQNDSRYCLLLCGSGELENEMRKFCQKENIQNGVIFAGVRNDIHELVQGMDIFLFPSFYEGLGIVLIEAQCAGLPCVISNRVPKEAIFQENVLSLDIDESSIPDWIEKIKNIQLGSFPRSKISTKLLENYDIKNVTKDLLKIYEGR